MTATYEIPIQIDSFARLDLMDLEKEGLIRYMENNEVRENFGQQDVMIEI